MLADIVREALPGPLLFGAWQEGVLHDDKRVDPGISSSGNRYALCPLSGRSFLGTGVF